MSRRLLIYLMIPLLTCGCASQKPHGEYGLILPPQTYTNMQISLFGLPSAEARFSKNARFCVLTQGDVIFSIYRDGHATAEAGNETWTFSTGQDVSATRPFDEANKTLLNLCAALAYLPEAVRDNAHSVNDERVARIVCLMLLSPEVSLQGRLDGVPDVIADLRLTNKGREIVEKAYQSLSKSP